MTAQQKSLNVLVIGDVCEDRYVHLDCSRVNPEGYDIPLGKELSENARLGMAWSVSRALNALNINTKILGTPFEYQSIKTRYIDYNNGCKTLLRVDCDILSPKLENIPYLQKYDAIVVSDYNKGFILYETLAKIEELANGIPLFLDTKKHDLSKFSKYCIKINKAEAEAVTAFPDMQNVIITLGDKGAVHTGITYEPYYQPNVVDTCGAGDAFLAGLVYGYFKDYFRRIEYGIVNSSLSVRYYGTQSPSEQELLEHMEIYRARS